MNLQSIEKYCYAQKLIRKSESCNNHMLSTLLPMGEPLFELAHIVVP